MYLPPDKLKTALIGKERSCWKLSNTNQNHKASSYTISFFLNLWYVNNILLISLDIFGLMPDIWADICIL